MGGNYEKGMYNQLMEVMARLDAMESELKNEKREHREDVDQLNARIDVLTQENQLLRDDNARLKSILNNDSSNTSLPPSTDQSIPLTAGKRPGAGPAARRDTKEQHFQKQKQRKRLHPVPAGM